MSSDLREAMARVVERAKEAAEAAEKDPEIRARLDKLAEDAIAAEAMHRRRAVENDWRARGIPERLWPMLHDSASSPNPGPLAPKATKALEEVGIFLRPADRKTILVLAGGVGVGKTVAAAWGAAFHNGRFVKILDLVRAGMFPDDPGFWPALERARVLVIDDLGTEPLDGKGYGLSCILDLLDRRYDAGRKTILTTNLTGDEFRARYGEGSGRRLVDRMREAGRFVHLAGESLRRPEAA